MRETSFGVEVSDVYSAKNRIGNTAYSTPLIRSRPLSRLASRDVYLKLENLQSTGSFKVRGAANKLVRLRSETDLKGVVAFSTGNHGRAVSYVAERTGIEAIVCMSENVPDHRIRAIERYGATVRITGESQDKAMKGARELAEKKGYEIVPPFDDPEIISGQGTIALEVFEELPELDSTIVPLSGGGLISGVGLVAKVLNPASSLIGVSMERSPVMFHSLREGGPVELKEQDTLADNLQGGLGQDNEYTFDMVNHLVDDVILVSEVEIANAIEFMLDKHSMVVEGAGAVGVAALMNGKLRDQGEKVVIVVSGRNIDKDQLLEVVSSQTKK